MGGASASVSSMPPRGRTFSHDVIRGTGLEIDYRYKLESIDLWETVVTTNDKCSLRGDLALA